MLFLNPVSQSFKSAFIELICTDEKQSSKSFPVVYLQKWKIPFKHTATKYYN